MKAELEQALQSASSIRFLCSGNVVRSAFADIYARHLECPLPVDSAATIFQNASIFEETRAALRLHGVPPTAITAFKPRHLSRISGEPSDDLLLFGMTEVHLEHWRSLYPKHSRCFLLAELEGSAQSIADPVMDGADFGETYARIADCVKILVVHLGNLA